MFASSSRRSTRRPRSSTASPSDAGFVPRLSRSADETAVRLGHPLLDAYLELVAARARPNTLLAHAFDLKVFFSIVVKDPVEVTSADVLAFIKAQRQPRRGAKIIGLEDGESGLAARTIKRRLATVAGLYEYLLVRGDTSVTRNPVPRGLAVQRPGQRAVRGVPLTRTPRTLPRVLEAADVDAFMTALRTHRDRAMVEGMLLGGLRRCEILGLRFQDIHPGERRVFIAEGKGGHQRIVPISPRFFATLAAYLDTERPRTSVTKGIFVVLKGARRGQPLTAAGLDEIVEGAPMRPTGYDASRLSVHITKPNWPSVASCAWTLTTGWWPTPWRPTGTRSFGR